MCVVVLDLLGSGVLGFVQNDIRGNIGERFHFALLSTKPHSFATTQGVRARYQADSSCCSTLENLVRNEASCEDQHGTGCLIRLTRYVQSSTLKLISSDSLITIVISSSGLTFLCRGQFIPRLCRLKATHSVKLALQYMQNDPSIELHVCFKRSYDEVLRRHHTFFVRSLAAVRQLLASLWRPPDHLWCFEKLRLLFGRRRIAMTFMLVSRKGSPRKN
jgi:hypothetical protein